MWWQMSSMLMWSTPMLVCAACGHWSVDDLLHVWTSFSVWVSLWISCLLEQRDLRTAVLCLFVKVIKDLYATETLAVSGYVVWTFKWISNQWVICCGFNGIVIMMVICINLDINDVTLCRIPALFHISSTLCIGQRAHKNVLLQFCPTVVLWVSVVLCGITVKLSLHSSTLWVKKHPIILLSVTSPNVDRFSKFFHWQTQW